MASDEKDAIRGLADWQAFCEYLQVTMERAGARPLRELDRRVKKIGLDLPRATVSRALKGDARPPKQLHVNLLMGLKMDEPTGRLRRVGPARRRPVG